MKGLVGLVLFVGGFGAVAQGNFEEKKAQALKHIDEKTQELATAKACVTAATTEDALKACRHDAKMKIMDHRMERMEKRKERMKGKEE